jgi:hypothetical protein
MPDRRPAFAAAAALLGALFVAAACSVGAPTPAPSPSPAATARPTPTSIAAPVTSPADAAALVVVTNPLFAGAVERKPDMIGGSTFWTATPLRGGGYRIELTVGWGDCPAGCIEKHVWTFDVDANGGVKLVGETGDPVPSDLPA